MIKNNLKSLTTKCSPHLSPERPSMDGVSLDKQFINLMNTDLRKVAYNQYNFATQKSQEDESVIYEEDSPTIPMVIFPIKMKVRSN